MSCTKRYLEEIVPALTNEELLETGYDSDTIDEFREAFGDFDPEYAKTVRINIYSNKK